MTQTCLFATKSASFGSRANLKILKNKKKNFKKCGNAIQDQQIADSSINL